MNKKSSNLIYKFSVLSAFVAFVSYNASLNDKEKATLIEKYNTLSANTKKLEQLNSAQTKQIKYLSSENENLESHQLKNQIFEAMVISANRGYKVVSNEYYQGSKLVECADTVEVFIGFNPSGLSCDYKSDLTEKSWGNKTYSRDILKYGYNKLILQTAVSHRYNTKNKAERKEFQKYITDIKNHTTDKDTLDFYYSADDKKVGLKDHSIFKLPVGLDLGLLDKIDPENPVLFVLSSNTQQPHRGGKISSTAMYNYSQSIYGSNNVVKIDDPTDQKIAELAKICHQKYSHTRFDFVTDFEHHGISSLKEIGGYFCYKTEESKARTLWSNENLMVVGSPILQESELVDWFKKFPGKLSEKRVFLSECGIDLLSKDSPLKKLGIVIAPAPTGLYNFKVSNGRLGQEAINNLYSFNENMPSEPQTDLIKHSLKLHYDRFGPGMTQEVQIDLNYPVISLAEINKELSDPNSQIYINKEIIFKGEKATLKKTDKHISEFPKNKLTY